MEKRNKFGIYDGCNLKVGGSALMEGVMMKNEDSVAMAVRAANGDIKVIKKPANKGKRKRKISKLVLIRGGYNLIESMVDSVYYLSKSAEFIDLEEDAKEPKKKKPSKEKTKKDSNMINIIMFFSVIISLIFSIGIFMLLPKVIVDLLGISGNVVLKNIIEGAIRITLFIGYILLTALVKDIKRVFSYHGAEHKSIHCYEHNEELTVENVKKYSTMHPRCGTSFMFLIMVISIMLFSFLDLGLNGIGLTYEGMGWTGSLIKILVRLLFMPLLAGITYEITRLSMRSKSRIIRAINAPGIAMQRLTTYEPDDSMMEVAIASLKAVLDKDIPYNTEEEIENIIKDSKKKAHSEDMQENPLENLSENLPEDL